MPAPTNLIAVPAMNVGATIGRPKAFPWGKASAAAGAGGQSRPPLEGAVQNCGDQRNIGFCVKRR